MLPQTMLPQTMLPQTMLPQTMLPQTVNNDKYKDIEEDVKHLKQSFDILHELVLEQQPHIDSIEEFIMVSKENTKKALVELKQAEEYNTSNSYFSYYASGFIALGLIFFLK
jgi:t-SNARE complex subunit (syntaxin)